MKPNKFSALRVAVLGTLASILSVGAVSTVTPGSANNPGTPARLGAPADTNTKRAPLTANAPTGGLLNLLAQHGSDDLFKKGPTRNGRKEWGMSAACHNKRLHNVRKGLVPHYRPRADV